MNLCKSTRSSFSHCITVLERLIDFRDRKPTSNIDDEMGGSSEAHNLAPECDGEDLSTIQPCRAIEQPI
jgi:hypothetical protein